MTTISASEALGSTISSHPILRPRVCSSDASTQCSYAGRPHAFVLGARVDRWAVLGILEESERPYLFPFVDLLITDAIYRGMALAPLEANRRRFLSADTDESELHRIMEWANKRKLELLLVVSTDNVHLHDRLKLMEQRYQIIVQEVNVATIVMCNRPAIRSLVGKINVKCGGITTAVNRSIRNALSDNTLVIGFEMSQATRDESDVKQPLVVGYSINIKDQRLIGGYVYGNLVAEVFPRLVKTAYDLFTRHTGGEPPNYIVVLRRMERASRRDGLNELATTFRFDRPYSFVVVERVGTGPNADVALSKSEFRLESEMGGRDLRCTVHHTDVLSLPNLKHLIRGLCASNVSTKQLLAFPVHLIVADRMARRGLHNYNETINEQLEKDKSVQDYHELVLEFTAEAANAKLLYENRKLSNCNFAA